MSHRITALDMTKGLLVVFMVLYHSLNYSTEYYLSFRYLAFLPPSFILITGFLLIHTLRGNTISGRPTINFRAITRGAKLLALFTLLNIGGLFVRSQNYHGPSPGIDVFVTHWFDTYISGIGRLAIFEVLLPIAYLLLLSPALLWLDRLHRVAIPALALTLLIVCAWLNRTDRPASNLFLIDAGIFGMLLGRLRMEWLNRLGAMLPFVLGAYMVLHFWGHLLFQGYTFQIVAATLALATLFGLAVRLGSVGWSQERLIRLGQYSLIAYIVQIAILQVISHFAGRPAPVSWHSCAMLLGTLILTTATVEITHWLRQQSNAIDGLYRAVLP